MRDYTSMQFLLVFLILVDQTLNAPAAKHSKKKNKHTETESHIVTIIDVGLQDATEFDPSAKKHTHGAHDHKTKHHTPLVSSTSQHKNILRHHFSKHSVGPTQESEESHKTELRRPDTHRHHESARKLHSHKTQSKHKSKHRVHHHDTDVGSNEDKIYKHVTKLDFEEPKYETRERKHMSNKKIESSEIKERDTDNTSKNHRVDSKFDSDEIWRPDIDTEKEERPSNSDDASTQDIKKHAVKESSHEEKKHHIVKKNKLPFYLSSTKLTKENDPKDQLEIILHESDSEIRSHANVKENETAPLVKQIVSVFKDKDELKNKRIDINATLNSLASSKLLDILTDRVANQMMKKLKKRFKENSLRTHDFGVTESHAIEQIEIVFRNDDEAMSRELKTENIYDKVYK